MKDQLAEEILARVLGWGPPQLAENGPRLQALAALKYDEYEGYRAGEKFLENLTAWLWQMDVGDRQVAIDFVLNRLMFISRSELEHAIETVYPDLIRPLLVRRVSLQIGVPAHLVRRITGSPEFRALQRRTLIVGLADGARLDRLRRASPELSHEQFYLVPELGPRSRESMQRHLARALHSMGVPDPANFRLVLLVDDFSGSGYTLLHDEGGGRWDGKLWRTNEDIESLRGTAIANDAEVAIVLYAASHDAQRSLREDLERSGLRWELHVVQPLQPEASITEPVFLALCKKYFDAAVLDEHLRKGGANPERGFGGVALPLVIHHNTPNNSVCVLWADTTEVAGSARRRGLFPRRRRHNPDRP
jgi:hypothetical protein